MRRARHFNVTGALLDSIFTSRPRNGDRFKGITSDAPEDVHITGIAGYEPMTDVWTFVAESAAFDEVVEGATPPRWDPTFTTHYDEAPADELSEPDGISLDERYKCLADTMVRYYKMFGKLPVLSEPTDKRGPYQILEAEEQRV